MQRIGIEKINLYAGRFCADALELANLQGKDLDYVSKQVKVKTRSVIPAYEDTVTLSVNAAKRLLSPEDARDIELLIVATESAVDFGKPVSTWVHRYCNLPAHCRSFELKHACYGLTAAVKTAAMWLQGGLTPGKKALVIGCDYSRPHLDDRDNFIGGGAAIAMLISTDPKVFEIDLHPAGFWTDEISDTFRPTARVEIGDNQTSLYSYLDALEASYTHYEKLVGGVDYDKDFQKHIYHTPFPGMPLQAHRTLLSLFDVNDSKIYEENYQKKVQEGIYFAQQVGSTYGSSTFLCLLSLLHHAQDLHAGDRISIFAYGSGCQGEFYRGTVSPGAIEYIRSLDIDRHLQERLPLSLMEYELLEYAREKYIDAPDYQPKRDSFQNAYDKLYAGQELLVLKQVKNYYRQYEWS
ncbi:hydroxymethylglutaryl-CoA synthase family protein [Nostoc sp. C057]|uniref:hydroxymethylglutaryl-CoA synthase family protein n=1 Tax=Nostoc sp. C057 TaxID=2576903 RepID=UPI0015C3E2F8|nr:hydroxymethylglutaryl-CoA synthase family protein [Nostoc sp. C057]QLE49250.1 hydroxymethylglutaryl-CoA synthase family protein [Nostoc sp. C057]